jgi:hypothetical protein
MSRARKDVLRTSLPGVVEHVSPATLQLADRRVETFSRGIGRNRVALLAAEPLEPGEHVDFSVNVDGGVISGRGVVERLHAEDTWAGEPETWLVIDVERLDDGCTGRLVRKLYRERYVEFAEEHPELRLHRPAAPPRPTEPPGELPLGERPPPPAPSEPKKRKRPSVARYEAPRTGDRWKARR